MSADVVDLVAVEGRSVDAEHPAVEGSADDEVGEVLGCDISVGGVEHPAPVRVGELRCD